MKDNDKWLNNKLGIIVSIVFILTAIVTVVLAAGIRSSEIDNLKEKTHQLCEEQKKLDEKKVDKAVYETAISNIDKSTQRIEQKLDRLIEKGN